MAKFSFPAPKDELLEQELFERKKKDMALLKKDDPALLAPDFSRTAREVLGDIQYKGIVARALGREFEEREFISESDLQKLMALADVNQNIGKDVEIKLIPIMKRGRKWEHKDSRRLRKQYIEKSHMLFDILSKFDFSGTTQSEDIFLSGDSIYDKTSAYLDFSSAAALVDKGPRKKKTTKASGSIYFREVYLGGRRGALFGLFDGFDERGLESLPSSIAVRRFRESAKSLGREDTVLALLEDFARGADAEISESVKGFCGASAACGVVVGKKLYYVNVGNNRIYGVGRGGETMKIAGDEPGNAESRELLYSQLKYPYLYLGGFTQRVKGKRSFRIIHTDFRLKAPNIGVADISDYASVLVASSGVWKSAVSISGAKLADGSSKFGETLARARNPLNAVERLNMQAKISMREAGNRTLVDDIAMLYFAV